MKVTRRDLLLYFIIMICVDNYIASLQLIFVAYGLGEIEDRLRTSKRQPLNPLASRAQLQGTSLA